MAAEWSVDFPRLPLYLHRINDTNSCSHHELLSVMTSAMCFCFGFSFGSVSGSSPVLGFVLDFIHSSMN